MIIKATKNEEELLKDVCSRHIYLDTLIYSDYLAYCDYGISSVYLITDDNNQSIGAFAAYGSSISASVRDGCDISELTDFCLMSPDIVSVELPCAAAEKISEKLNARTEIQNVMIYEGGEKQAGEVCIDFTPRLCDVFKLLQQVSPRFMQQSVFENWLVDKSHKRRHCIAQIAAIYDGDKVVSTGGIYSKSPQYSLIESVATLPAYRGKGYAEAILSKLCSHAIKSGRTPILACDNELVAFYQRLGFRLADKFSIVYIK